MADLWTRSVKTVSTLFSRVDAMTVELKKQDKITTYDVVTGTYDKTKPVLVYETQGIVNPINEAAGKNASQHLHRTEPPMTGGNLIVDNDFRILLSPLELVISNVQIYPENEDTVVIWGIDYKIKHLVIIRPSSIPILFVAYVGKI